MPTNQHGLNAIMLPARPVENRIIHITIEGIVAVDGSTMAGPITSFYTTSFNPFYSSAMRVRLIAGEFLTEVPDDTINQLVWYYSKEADLKNYVPDASAVNPTTYTNYKARYVTAAVIVTLLSGTSINSDMSKRLGDLSVKRNGAARDLLDSMRDELGWLCGVLEDGGYYGRSPLTTSKGSGHPDAPIIGRLFARADTHASRNIPGANIRSPFYRTSDGRSQKRWKKTWGRS
jgi:hypothetical protein